MTAVSICQSDRAYCNRENKCCLGIAFAYLSQTKILLLISVVYGTYDYFNELPRGKPRGIQKI